MRVIDLGHWLYWVWHLPSVLLAFGSLGVGVWMARSLVCDDLTARARATRFRVLGWSSIMASVLSVLVWPYLSAVSEIDVRADGRWSLRNYLGVPIASIPAGERRSLRAEDLGGLHLGMGQIRIVRANGRVLTTVRISGPTFEAARRALAYPDSMLLPAGSAVEIPAHRYGPTGPIALVALR